MPTITGVRRGYRAHSGRLGVNLLISPVQTSKPLTLGEVRGSGFIYTQGRKVGAASKWLGGDSEVRLLFCDGRDGAIALDLGLTVINGHRPWAGPKLAPHFQISAGDCQLL